MGGEAGAHCCISLDCSDLDNVPCARVSPVRVHWERAAGVAGDEVRVLHAAAGGDGGHGKERELEPRGGWTLTATCQPCQPDAPLLALVLEPPCATTACPTARPRRPARPSPRSSQSTPCPGTSLASTTQSQTSSGCPSSSRSCATTRPFVRLTLVSGRCALISSARHALLPPATARHARPATAAAARRRPDCVAHAAARLLQIRSSPPIRRGRPPRTPAAPVVPAPPSCARARANAARRSAPFQFRPRAGPATGPATPQTASRRCRDAAQARAHIRLFCLPAGVARAPTVRVLPTGSASRARRIRPTRARPTYVNPTCRRD